MTRTNRQTIVAAACALALAAGAGAPRAATIVIPNASFESPAVNYAAPFVDYWQQVPQPDLNNQSTLLTGVFSNVPPAIDNCDGGQAAFLFAVPYVALFQDYDSTDYANPTPLHAFGATFDLGKSYALTVGVLGGTNLTEPMQEGTTLELSLYYRDTASNQVTVAAISITNSGALFPSATHLVDFQVQVPTVKAGDAWAGQHIGIQFLSTVSPDLVGGYWDLDNVRLTSTVTPVLVAPFCTNGQFSFILQSEPGLRFEVLVTTNLALPVSNWTSLGTLTNLAGTTSFTDTTAPLNRRFYLARQLP